jgi:hypothetical protein
MQTTLTIAGTDFDGPGRDAAGICGLQFTWDLEAYWSVTFCVNRLCNADLPFVPGVPVQLSADTGSGAVVVFKGDLQRPQTSVSEYGVAWLYSCTDLKRRGDYISLTGLDGSGTANFNLPPNDPLALFATSGQTVGDIVKAVLQQPTNAAALSASGVGAYTSLSPPTLPAATLADLAALAVVPPEAVQLAGDSILNRLEQFILRWHPQYCLYVLGDGTIRVRSIFGLPAHAVALPDSSGGGDDIEWPDYDGPDCTDCYTAWQVTGLDIQAAYLSQAEGTLSKAWTTGAGSNEALWTIRDFTQPRKAKDTGTCTVTSTTATVASDQTTTTWGANYWNGPAVGGWIYLYYSAASGGIVTDDIFELRQITSCTAMAAGTSATITWDSSLPISSTAYNRYRIVGINTPLGLVGREFHVREPATGKVDLDTFVGSHMYPVNPKGMPVANNSRVATVYYPYALVQWSSNNAYPYFEVPVGVQLNPLTGRIVLTEPAVLKSAQLAGTVGVLANHYPTTAAEGLYHDIQVVIPYNRGALTARSPTTSYSGTAFTKYGVQRVFVQHLDDFTWAGDRAALTLLAAEHLACVRDAVISGSISWRELPASFDCLTPGFCLNATMAGGTTPLDGLELPVRSCTVRWHDDGPTLYSASMRFSNLKRPFQGDSLYIHPALGTSTFGTSEGVFGIGSMADVMGEALKGTQFTNTPVGQDAMGQHPVGQDVTDNPIARSLGPKSSDPLGDIAAQHQQLGAQLNAQAHPGDAFGAVADQVNAGLDAQNAPIAANLQAQAQAGQPGDPFGVMEGFRAGQPNRTRGREARSRPATGPEPMPIRPEPSLAPREVPRADMSQIAGREPLEPPVPEAQADPRPPSLLAAREPGLPKLGPSPRPSPPPEIPRADTSQISRPDPDPGDIMNGGSP